MTAENLATLDIPPNSAEAEAAVIGAVLLDNTRLDEITDQVEERDFYRGVHRDIWRAILELAGKGGPIDVLTLGEHMKKPDAKDDSALAYLGGLAHNVPSAANAEAYAKQVRGYAIRRDLIAKGQRIKELGYISGTEDLDQAIEECERLILAVAQGRRGGELPDFKKVLEGMVDRVDLMFQNGSAVTGVATGFIDLDEKLAGLQPSDLIILGGRPSMGKTALALNIAEHALLVEKVPVGIFSMEMSSQQVAMRLNASVGRLDLHKLRNGQLEDADWPKLTSAIGQLTDAPLHIDDTGGLSPFELRSRARRMKREHGVGLIIVDYLQLMSGDGENRNLEISAISRSLKALAKELDVPVLALSQLNRALETRTEKRPSPSDLRDSGSLEQDADVVLFVYRDEVHHKDSPDAGTAEVIIGKQRNGPIGDVKLAFQDRLARFDNLAAQHYVK